MIINGEVSSTVRAKGFTSFAHDNSQLNLDAASPQVDFLKKFADIEIINGGGDGAPFFLEGLLCGLPFFYKEEGTHASLRVASERKTVQREVVDVDFLAVDLGLIAPPVKPYPKKAVEEIVFPYLLSETALYASTQIEDSYKHRHGWEWVEALLRLVEVLEPMHDCYWFSYDLVTEKDGLVERSSGETLSYSASAEDARQNLIASWKEIFKRFPGQSELSWSESPSKVTSPAVVDTEIALSSFADQFRNTEGLISFNFPLPVEETSPLSILV